jgi:hypothetical protein
MNIKKIHNKLIYFFHKNKFKIILSPQTERVYFTKHEKTIVHLVFRLPYWIDTYLKGGYTCDNNCTHKYKQVTVKEFCRLALINT